MAEPSSPSVRRWVCVTMVLAVGLGLGALLALVSVVAQVGSDEVVTAEPLPCRGFKPDRDAWRQDSHGGWVEPKVAAQQVSTVLACGKIPGATRREISAMLGAEESREVWPVAADRGLWSAGQMGVDVRFDERGKALTVRRWQPPVD